MSYGLTAENVAELRRAAAFASDVGLPLTRFVTVHWEAIGIADGDAREATGRLLKLAGDWSKAAGGGFAAVWVRETGLDKGSHVHILWHVPRALDGRYRPMLRRWIKAIRGKAPHVARTAHTRSIGGNLAAAYAAPEHFAVNLSATLAYIIKGALPHAAEAHGLSKLEPGGAIIGKRAGTTQNIGCKARQCASGRPHKSSLLPSAFSS